MKSLKDIKLVRSPNFSKYANGKPKQFVKRAVVIHSTVGSLEGAVSWLTTSPEERKRKFGKKTYSSAHTISDSGKFYQLIDFEKRAWHAGGVTRMTDRAKRILTGDDANNVTIGHEFANYFDRNRDGKVSDSEKRLADDVIEEFVDFMFLLEAESKKSKWLDIRADEKHLLTHFDTNHHKPNMEADYLKIVERMKARRGMDKSCEDKLEEQERITDVLKKLVHMLVKKLQIK